MASQSITVIGSLNTDLITRTTRLPSGGETLISQSFSTGSGGKGANQAVACARLSRSKNDASGTSTQEGPITIRMIGAVGDDTFGTDLLKDLQRNGIDTQDVTMRKGERSGVAVIIVEEQTGENRILMSPNANFSLRPEEFSSLPSPLPDLLVLQLEIPLTTTLQISKTAREQKVDVLLNPAPAQDLPVELWESVTHLIVNETEASIITQSTTTASPPSWLQWGDHTSRIIALGVRHVTITLGAKGVLYIDTHARKFWLFPAHKVKAVIDTTAAGDTFVGAYAVAARKLKGKGDEASMAGAVRWANAAAAKAVEREGAQDAIPWADEVEKFDRHAREEGMVLTREDFDREVERLGDVLA